MKFEFVVYFYEEINKIIFSKAFIFIVELNRDLLNGFAIACMKSI